MSTTTTPPVAPRAPRRVWAAVWRLLTVTLLGLLAFLIIWGMVLEPVPTDSPDAPRIVLRLVIDLIVGVAIIVIYALRHRFPTVAPYLGVALSAFSVLGSVAAAALVVTVSARRRSRRSAVHIVVIAVLFFALSLVDVTVYPFPDETTALWEVVVVGAVMTVSLVLLGLLVGARRQLQQARVEQAEAAEAARLVQVEQSLSQARLQERSRIAREMHDVLGHRLSLMAVHAGALEYRRDLSPEQTAETAGLIRANSRLALDELRDILGVLRDDPAPEAVSAPQPDAGDIPALIEEARAAGGVIDVQTLEVEGIPTTVGRNLFRITQELLTNARRHAQGERLELRISREASAVRLVAGNTMTTAGAPTSASAGGFGLIGVAERARLAGGEYTLTTDEGRFEVSVVIPWQS